MLNRTAPRFKRQKTNYRAHTKGFVSFALFQIKCDRGSSHTCYIPQKCLHMGKTHTPYNTALDQETPVLKWHKSWSPKLIPTSPGRIGLQLCQGHLWYPQHSTALVLFTNNRLLNSHRLSTLVWAMDTWGKSFNTMGFCLVAHIILFLQLHAGC